MKKFEIPLVPNRIIDTNLVISSCEGLILFNLIRLINIPNIFHINSFIVRHNQYDAYPNFNTSL